MGLQQQTPGIACSSILPALLWFRTQISSVGSLKLSLEERAAGRGLWGVPYGRPPVRSGEDMTGPRCSFSQAPVDPPQGPLELK